MVKLNGYNKKLISIKGLVTASQYPVSKIDLKTPCRRKECFFQDEKGFLILHLWNEKVDDIPADGTYQILDVLIRSLDGELIVSTMSTTSSVPDNNIKVVPKAMPYALVHEISFPLSNVVVSNRVLKCPNCACTVDLPPSPGNFFKCVGCGTSCKFAKVPIARTLHVTPSCDEDVTVTVYPSQVKEFMRHHEKMHLMNDEDVICESFLLDEKTTMLVNRKSVCICFH